MNILIINHYAGSPELGMEIRPYYLAKEWVKLGHKVTILAADFSHLRLIQPKVSGSLTCENIDGIAYIWLRTTKYKTSGFKRVLNMLEFITKLIINYRKITNIVSPQIVIASSTYPLDIYPAYLIAKKNKAKLVFELHDLWPLSPMVIGGYSKFHPFIWLIQKAENFACRNCDYYISMLANARRYLRKHGLKREKFFFMPKGFSNDEMIIDNAPLPREHQRRIIEAKTKSRLIIGYTGGHAPSNALKCFVSASKHFDKSNDIAFILVGKGSQKHELIKMAQEKNQKNIYFLPTISKTLMPGILRQFDILYAGGVKSVLHSYGTSFTKITDYLLAEKPIIFAVDEPNSIVKKIGCGIQIPAENESEIIKAISSFAELSNEELTSMGKKGREYAMQELNYTTLAKKYLEIIKLS